MLGEQGRQTVDDKVQDSLVDAHLHLREEESTDLLIHQLIQLNESHDPGKTQQSDSLTLTFVTVTRVSRCKKSETPKVGQQQRKKAPVWHASQNLSDAQIFMHASIFHRLEVCCEIQIATEMLKVGCTSYRKALPSAGKWVPNTAT